MNHKLDRPPSLLTPVGLGRVVIPSYGIDPTAAGKPDPTMSGRNDPVSVQQRSAAKMYWRPGAVTAKVPLERYLVRKLVPGGLHTANDLVYSGRGARVRFGVD